MEWRDNVKLTLKNDAGMVKEVKKGFSWTVFFFGVFVPLIRGDLKWAGIMLMLSILAGIFTAGFGAMVPGLIFSFVYNKIYIKDLYEKGYRAADESQSDLLLNYVNS
jgi:hypothetical protein